MALDPGRARMDSSGEAVQARRAGQLKSAWQEKVESKSCIFSDLRDSLKGCIFSLLMTSLGPSPAYLLSMCWLNG